jgi:YidC/Oxa1 family membrane protein insertase
MDRKSIIVLVLSFALILIWPKLMNHFYPPPPKSTNTVMVATNTATTNIASTNATTNSIVATNAIAAIEENAPEQLLTVTNENAIYEFTSRGGGLKLIELRHYPESVECGKTTPAESRMATLNTKAPAPILGWTTPETPVNGAFHLSRDGDIVRAEKTFTNGLALIKEFQLSSNYLVNAKVRLENRSGHTMTIPAHEVVVGTATPMTVRDETIMMGTFWYNGAKAEKIDSRWFANRTLGCFPGTPRTEFQGGFSNVVWAAVNNQFFAIALIPQEPAPKVISREISLPPPTKEEIGNESKPQMQPKGFESALAYPPLTLTANQGMERHYTIYAGPREYNLLARIGAAQKNDLDAVMGFSGFFGFFIKLLLLSLNGLHAMGLQYGLAIIAITIIVKVIFWPFTMASTRSMKRMQALQPQMKAIAEKYKDDPVKKNQKTMEFMKENKVSPLGGCLPMVLQIPVFWAFYRMLQNAIELRGVSFLWACDLSQPDTVGHIAALGNFPINPLPLIMGVTMLWQARVTPPSPGMDPSQQKIMRYMPLMMIAIFYKMAAGLTLYYAVQNVLTIVQTKLTRVQDEKAKGTVAVVPPKKRK